MRPIIKQIIPVALVTVLGLTGCLKDDNYTSGNFQSVHSSLATQNTIEVGLTPRSTGNFYFLSLNNSSNDTTIALMPIILDAPNAAPQDIHVTLKLDSVLLANYNAANGTSYSLPSSSTYTIVNPGSVVTIPAGSNTGYVQVKFKPSNYLSGSPAFAFSIASVDNGYNISGNIGNGIVAIGVKNQFDGNYLTTGTLVDATVPTITGPYPWHTSLVTSGALQVQVQDNDYTGGIYHEILSGGAQSYYGAFGVVINFNPDNTVASVVNLYGQPASNGRSAQLDPSGVNKFDPATKTLKIKYWMNQPGATHRTSFDETFTYTGPR